MIKHKKLILIPTFSFLLLYAIFYAYFYFILSSTISNYKNNNSKDNNFVFFNHIDKFKISYFPFPNVKAKNIDFNLFEREEISLNIKSKKINLNYDFFGMLKTTPKLQNIEITNPVITLNINKKDYDKQIPFLINRFISSLPKKSSFEIKNGIIELIKNDAVLKLEKVNIFNKNNIFTGDFEFKDKIYDINFDIYEIGNSLEHNISFNIKNNSFKENFALKGIAAVLKDTIEGQSILEFNTHKGTEILKNYTDIKKVMDFPITLKTSIEFNYPKIINFKNLSFKFGEGNSGKGNAVFNFSENQFSNYGDLKTNISYNGDITNFNYKTIYNIFKKNRNFLSNNNFSLKVNENFANEKIQAIIETEPNEKTYKISKLNIKKPHEFMINAAGDYKNQTNTLRLENTIFFNNIKNMISTLYNSGFNYNLNQSINVTSLAEITKDTFSLENINAYLPNNANIKGAILTDNENITGELAAKNLDLTEFNNAFNFKTNLKDKISVIKNISANKNFDLRLSLYNTKINNNIYNVKTDIKTDRLKLNIYNLLIKDYAKNTLQLSGKTDLSNNNFENFMIKTSGEFNNLIKKTGFNAIKNKPETKILYEFNGNLFSPNTKININNNNINLKISGELFDNIKQYDAEIFIPNLNIYINDIINSSNAIMTSSPLELSYKYKTTGDIKNISNIKLKINNSTGYGNLNINNESLTGTFDFNFLSYKDIIKDSIPISIKQIPLLGFINANKLDLNLKIDNFEYKDNLFKNVTLRLNTLNPDNKLLTVTSNDSQKTVESAINFNANNFYKGNIYIKGLDIKDGYFDTQNLDLTSGALTYSNSFTTKGISSNDILSNLKANYNITVEEGKIKGVSLDYITENILNLSTKNTSAMPRIVENGLLSGYTSFDTFNLTAKIDNGIIKNGLYIFSGKNGTGEGKIYSNLKKKSLKLENKFILKALHPRKEFDAMTEINGYFKNSGKEIIYENITGNIYKSYLKHREETKEKEKTLNDFFNLIKQDKTSSSETNIPAE